MQEPHEPNLFAGLNKKQLIDIAFIVDLGPRHLETVTSDNLVAVVNAAGQVMKDKGQAYYARQDIFNPNLSPAQIYSFIWGRHSQTHALQCDITEQGDFTGFRDYLKNHPDVDVEAYPVTNEYIQQLLKILPDTIAMYKVEVARRIAAAKADPAMQHITLEQAHAVAQRLMVVLERLQLPGTEAVQERLQDVEQIDLTGWYEDICLPISKAMDRYFNRTEHDMRHEMQQLSGLADSVKVDHPLYARDD